MFDIHDISEVVYQETFDKMYDSLVAEYKNGEIDLETLERNEEEQQKVLMNGLYEGETKFAHTNAIVDAHQFVITLIKNGKIRKED
ncbi:MAG: hypothetical protein MR673_01910 [Fusobacterium perfoetens]|nr:hypothetical protein [Fusobacterium perfoetens]MCI6151865.1 hypothetical protein [Fusobacterium perfoetens]MDY3236774.1 hypothetical protein [Fusobacterium perfoetens]